MAEKNWFKITVLDGDGPYSYHGTSSMSLAELTKALESNKFIVLDDLLYMERGDYKEWSEWDKAIIPSVSLSPESVRNIMQYKGDPRKY